MTVIQTQTEEKGVAKLCYSSQCKCFLAPSHNARSLALTQCDDVFDVSSSKLGSVPYPSPVDMSPDSYRVGQCGSLGSLDMVHLGLIIGGRVGFLILHQT